MIEASAGETIAPSADFWTWSNDRYGRKGVSTLLLRLQDQFDLNVNLVLWCLWCADRYGEIPELTMRKAHDMTQRWNIDVTVALRRARRILKSPPPQANADQARALREKIKSAELDAEEVEQSMLQQLAETTLDDALSEAAAAGDAAARGRRNLAQYAALAGAPARDGFSVSLLEQAIEAILPSAPQSSRMWSDV